MLVKQGQPFPQTCYVTGGIIIPRVDPYDVEAENVAMSSEVRTAAITGGGVFFYVEESREYGPITREGAEEEEERRRDGEQYMNSIDWGERW